MSLNHQNGRSDGESSPSSSDDKTPGSERSGSDPLSSNDPPSSNDLLSSNDPPSSTGPPGSMVTSPNSESDSLSSNIRISDVGIYSLCGLTSILCHELYSEESNREFCKDTISELLNHLGLSSNQVKNSMFALLDGEGGHPKDFITLLKQEELLASSCVPIIEALILFSIRGGVYDARMRVLILKIADLFDIPKALVDFHEESVIEMLSNEQPVQSDEQLKEKARRLRNRKIKKYLLIGSGTLVGGAILGLTGGLVAPYLAIGAVSVFGAGSAAALGSTTGVAIIGSLFGVAGAGLTGQKMKKRVGDIEEFEFQVLNDSKSLEITILVSGWINDRGPDAFKTPWVAVQNTREQYCVRYESTYLLELGKALEYFLGFAISMGVQEALKFTILSGIMAAIAWPTTLLTLSSVIDNPYSCVLARSAHCGRYLAETLLNREHGKRPVTLIGFSLGARVIFFCLLELAQRENSEGIIQDAIMLGAPVSGSLTHWSKFSKVVSGRIVNGYCRGDWLLKFLYRTTNASIKIAGLDAIDWKDRRMENVDLSDIVSGHLDYYKNLPEVLKKVGVPVNDNELSQTNSLMKKSATGLPQPSHLVKLKANDVRVSSIRMSISEPNFSQTAKGEDATRTSASSLIRNGKLERSLSLEDLQIKRSTHYKARLSKMSHSHTFTDFKREQAKEISVNSSAGSSHSSVNHSSANNELSASSPIDYLTGDPPFDNPPLNNHQASGLSSQTNGGSTLNGAINRAAASLNEPKPPTKSRLSSFLSRFSRRAPENLEELKEEHEDGNPNDALKEALKDELSGDDKLNGVPLSATVDANLLKEIKDEKLKDALNLKIKNELKDNIMLGELNDEKIKQLNRKNQSEPDSPVCSVKRSDAEFLQLNVDSLSVRKSVLKRI